MDSKELAIAAVQILDRKKADQVHLINISEISTLGDYFVLATGTSGRMSNLWRTNWNSV